jgi:hypothetical protein
MNGERASREFGSGESGCLENIRMRHGSGFLKAEWALILPVFDRQDN